MEDKDFESLENFANHPLVVHKKVFERVMRKYFTMKRVGPMLAEEDISDKAMEMVDKALEARTYYFGSYTSNKFAEVTMYNHFFADSELEEIDAELIQVQNKINEYYAIQQRLLGYRQALHDQENGTTESDGSD